MPSKLYVFLSNFVSRAGCGIGLYRFLSVAFSSSLIVFILRPIALRMSYSTKIDLPIMTHHYPPEDKN